MSENKVYSPTQAALGALLGGPIASTYFIKQNFSTLNKEQAIKSTLLIGGIIVFILLATIPFTPDEFPNIAIPLITVISTRLIIEKFQFTKANIVENENLNFHSNWKVLSIGIISMLIFFILATAVIFMTEMLGLSNLTNA